jgi:hypothetical protein
MSARSTRLLFALVLVMDLVVVTVALGAINVDPNAAFAADRSHLKVAIIVGPVASLTDDYRELADEAAAAARTWTDQVVTVYSPNATWPAARAALRDASIVVYLGHGNGWPSPYRDKLYGRTQNGLGLNPVAGVDDEAHQYFGEKYLSSITLAPGAVVILGHLCYASGNPEPGGPNPTLDVARQRVDNYAAGWMAAGAVAVVAEGHGRPAYYVTSLLRGRGTIEHMWLAAPTFHDHVVEFPSARTAAAQVMLDPDRSSGGFFRSLTTVPGARIADTLRSAPTTPAGSIPAGPSAPERTPDPRALAQLGARFGTPEFIGPPVAATDAILTVPVDAATLGLLPDKVMVGTRWDPLPPDALPAPTPTAELAVPAESTPTAGPTPTAEPTSTPSVVTGTTVPPSAGDPAVSDEPPPIDLIEAESPGEVVTTHPSVRNADGLTLQITTPSEPGLYRLVTTIHDAEGIAYDAETQDLIAALIVRVTGDTWASYGVDERLDVDSGQAFSAHVRLANTGTLAWSMPWSERTPALVARWVALDDIETFAGPPGETALVPAVIGPGTSGVLDVPLRAPTRPGRYLLLFDIQDGDGISLASIGVPPGLVRVVVQPTGPADGSAGQTP